MSRKWTRAGRVKRTAATAARTAHRTRLGRCGAVETDGTQRAGPAAKPEFERTSTGDQSEVAAALGGRGPGRCGELSEPSHLFSAPPMALARSPLTAADQGGAGLLRGRPRRTKPPKGRPGPAPSPYGDGYRDARIQRVSGVRR